MVEVIKFWKMDLDVRHFVKIKLEILSQSFCIDGKCQSPRQSAAVEVPKTKILSATYSPRRADCMILSQSFCLQRFTLPNMAPENGWLEY